MTTDWAQGPVTSPILHNTLGVPTRISKFQIDMLGAGTSFIDQPWRWTSYSRNTTQYPNSSDYVQNTDKPIAPIKSTFETAPYAKGG
ncbi:hypothetical protein HYALB_00011053 [Hymenoscyphus albidus]|uniref:Uncharacterized protein n=1 Tax=Hymenoscyphus albidus TaxID=595503 RepID=A0A9N9LQN3_9HELO|nr:hypothetical protein HYALB_00011053 [Hymenoscyphus albidus]